MIREENLSPDFGKATERRPLLPRSPTTARSLSRRRKRSMSTHAQGDATVTQAVLMVYIYISLIVLSRALFVDNVFL